MAHRTTILLDDETRKAARDIAHRLGCSTSEAIRRAILRFRDQSTGVSPDERRRRVKVLNELIARFDGRDAREEVARIKAEDAGS